MTKERDIEILEYNIAELQTKIDNFGKYDIDNKKILALEVMKAKYETQLANILNS